MKKTDFKLTATKEKKISNPKKKQSNFSIILNRFLVLGVSSLAILFTAASCSLFGGSKDPAPIYGVFKRDPDLQREKNLNPEGFAVINSVKTDAGVDTAGLYKTSSLKISRFSKKKLFLLTKQNGLFKTQDEGLNWERVYVFNLNEGDKNTQIKKNNALEITDFVVDPKTDKIIYVTAVKNGISKIYQSLDGGSTFKEVYTEIVNNVRLELITLDPLNSLRVYAVLNEGALIRSLDGGLTWEKVRSFQDRPMQLGFVPEYNNIFYVLFEKDGLATSADQGETWQLRELKKSESDIGERQPKDGLDISFRKDLTFGRYDKIVPVTANIKVDYETGTVQNSLGKQPWILVADRQMWYSDDAGRDFKKLVLPSQSEQYDLYAITPDPVNGLDKIYVSVDNNLFITTNRGKSWTGRDLIKLNEGFIGNISQILIEPENPEIIYLTIVDERFQRNGFTFF